MSSDQNCYETDAPAGPTGEGDPLLPPARAPCAENAQAWRTWLGNKNLSLYEVLGIPHSEALRWTAAEDEIIARLAAGHDRVIQLCSDCAASGLEELCASIKGFASRAFDKLTDAKFRAAYNWTLSDGRTGRNGGLGNKLLTGKYGKLRSLVGQLSESNLRLPRIIVIGSESAGKSSTLERVAMRCAFPRKASFCTRMPICLSLKRSMGANSVTVRSWRVREGRRESQLMDDQEVASASVDQAAGQDAVSSSALDAFIQQEVAKVHDQTNAGRAVVADVEFEIEICANNVPDIDLVDLPGIVSVPDESARRTRALAERFLSIPNTLVLLVVDSKLPSIRSDVGFDVIAQAARKTQGLWQRTILVLTKVDLDAEHLCNRIVPGKGELEGVPLHRVVPVINRVGDGDADAADALPIVLKREREWFAAWCKDEGSSLKPENMGIDGLLMHLDALVDQHICTFWIPAEISRHSEERNKLTRFYGLASPDIKDVKRILEDVLNKVPAACTKLFNNELKNSALVELIDFNSSPVSAPLPFQHAAHRIAIDAWIANVNKVVRNACQMVIREAIRSSMPSFASQPFLSQPGGCSFAFQLPAQSVDKGPKTSAPSLSFGDIQNPLRSALDSALTEAATGKAVSFVPDLIKAVELHSLLDVSQVNDKLLATLLVDLVIARVFFQAASQPVFQAVDAKHLGEQAQQEWMSGKKRIQECDEVIRKLRELSPSPFAGSAAPLFVVGSVPKC